MPIVSSPEAEKQFRDYIGYGKTTIPVIYKGKVWQMCRIGGDLLFVRIDGYNGDLPDVIPGVSEDITQYLKGRRFIKIPAGSVADVTLSGQYTDYVTLGGAELFINIAKGNRKKTIRIEIMGSINEFLLREFLKGICRNMKVIKSAKTSPVYALEAMLLFFNRKSGRLNRLMIIIAAVSCLLVIMDSLIITPYNNLLTGIGALLPLVNFFIYLKNSRLISFFSQSVKNNTKYVCRRYVGFYSKFGMPSVAGMLAAFGGRTLDIDIAKVFLFGGILFAVIVILLALILLRQKYRYILLAGYSLIMMMYSAQSVQMRKYSSTTVPGALRPMNTSLTPCRGSRASSCPRISRETTMTTTRISRRGKWIPAYWNCSCRPVCWSMRKTSSAIPMESAATLSRFPWEMSHWIFSR